MAQGSATGSAQLSYTWDAENRLIQVQPVSPVNGDKKVVSDYDYMSRRVRKRVYTYSGGSWGSNPTVDRRYVYDQRNLVLELNGLSANTALRKYTWGLDLAGQAGGGIGDRGSGIGVAQPPSAGLSGAGGIGGLLAQTDTVPNPDKNYITFCDANGNIGQFIDISNGTSAAKYEYDASGNTLVASGTYAATNVLRFSTKYFDTENGLGYWGYRYYNAKLGRWPSRDPAGERAQFSLQEYARNAPVITIDTRGDIAWWVIPAVLFVRYEVDTADAPGPLPLGRGAYITHFDDCTPIAQQLINTAAGNACKCIRRAQIIASSRRLWDAAMTAYPASYPFSLYALGDGFPSPTGSYWVSFKELEQQRIALIPLLQIMANDCDSGFGIECECACTRSSGNEANAYVRTWNHEVWWTDIHVCPSFFGLSSRNRENTLIHELAHYTNILPAHTNPLPPTNQFSEDAYHVADVVQSLCDMDIERLIATSSTAPSRP
jgi:RHS repeat-associated protein